MTTLLRNSSGDHAHHAHIRPGSPGPGLDGDGGGDDGLEITVIQKMVSAMSGSLVTSLLATPLDVVRVRLQSQQASQPGGGLTRLALGVPPPSLGITACCREVFFNTNTPGWCLASSTAPGSGSAGSAAECAAEAAQSRIISSTLDGLRKIARNEGVTTLWRGLSPTLLMVIPSNIIYFNGYDWLRTNEYSPFSRLRDAYAPLLAGSSARTLAAMAVCPIELFKTRLQSTPGTLSSSSHLRETWTGVQDMVRAHGYRALWRGLALMLWRDVPFSGLYWWGYETVRGVLSDARDAKAGRDSSSPQGRLLTQQRQTEGRGRARRWSRGHESHADTFVDSFVAGASSGALASILTMPFDVGKTRTQVFHDGSRLPAAAPGSAAAAAAAAPEARHMGHLLWHIFKTEGIPGLWRGWIPRTLKVAPACAIMISSYEVGKRAFRGANERAKREGGGG